METTNNHLKVPKSKNKILRLKQYKDKLKGHPLSIVGIYSPEGEKGGQIFSLSQDGCLRAWNVYERRKLKKLYLKRSADKDIDSKDASQSQVGDKQAFDPLDVIESCMFNKATVFCGYSDGSIYAWNMNTGTLIYQFQGHEDKVSALEWLDPNSFASSSYDQTIVFWDTQNGSPLSIIKLEHEINAMSKEGDTLFAISNYNQLNLISTKTSEIFRTVLFADSNINAIHATPVDVILADSTGRAFVVNRVVLEV